MIKAKRIKSRSQALTNAKKLVQMVQQNIKDLQSAHKYSTFKRINKINYTNLDKK